MSKMNDLHICYCSMCTLFHVSGRLGASIFGTLIPAYNEVCKLVYIHRVYISEGYIVLGTDVKVLPPPGKALACAVKKLQLDRWLDLNKGTL